MHLRYHQTSAIDIAADIGSPGIKTKSAFFFDRLQKLFILR